MAAPGQAVAAGASCAAINVVICTGLVLTAVEGAPGGDAVFDHVGGSWGERGQPIRHQSHPRPGACPLSPPLSSPRMRFTCVLVEGGREGPY